MSHANIQSSRVEEEKRSESWLGCVFFSSARGMTCVAELHLDPTVF